MDNQFYEAPDSVKTLGMNEEELKKEWTKP